ncbi:MAG: molybdopterin molybdotransferase [Planctomycetota bacterium]|jgi:molybdopterin molybdotransferase
MRTPKEAVSIILERSTAQLEIEPCVLREAVGRVLGEAVDSDIDLPPFEKSAMDGFAVHRSDFKGLQSGSELRLKQLGESRAGEPFDGPIGHGECVAIYTGAELPADCDAVVMVEKSRQDGDFVFLADDPADRQHVCARGEDLRKGQEVLAAGRRLTPAMVSVLASVGCEPVPVVRRPRMAILTSGDELIEPTQYPGPGQIRESNVLHIAALARAAGADVVRAGVVRDNLEGLIEAFRSALEECDVLVTTGGVSMGKYDLVGEALEAVGVEKVFHKVAIKPGKPVWFGVAGETLVFGLPGNPVSCWVGHEVFVQPAIAKLSGLREEEWIAPLRKGRWVGSNTRLNDRQQNLPVTVVQGMDGVDELATVRWKSSADLVGLSRAEGLVVVPPGESLTAGDIAYFRLLG